MPEMQYVVSSNVDQVGYDMDQSELYVQFIDGGLYVYTGVPETTFEQLLLAPSVGSYLNLYVKNSFPYRKEA